MSQMVSRHTQQPGKVSRLSVLGRPNVAGHNMRPSSRTALEDIGNLVTEPKAQGATRNRAMGGGGGREPGGRPVNSRAKTNEVAGRKETAAPTKGMPPTAPEPKSEPQVQQLESHSQIPTEIPACAPPDDVMCQACSHDLLSVENIVAEDNNDPEYSHDYAKDIYQYLRELEENQTVRPKYLAGQKISGNMRDVLIDWLVQVQIKFRLLQDTLYKSVAIIDCFLQDNAVYKKMLQLVGVTAVFIASKYEEPYPLRAADLVYITDNTYTTSQIIQMEFQILQALNFHLSHPLTSQFLDMALEIAKVTTRQCVLAKYLMELSIVDYDMVHFLPPRLQRLLYVCLWNFSRDVSGHKLYNATHLTLRVTSFQLCST
uniref:Uncharacterized protein n=1 Tax=Melopsittacus undulatus TaxID=13146 RepID=A0A8C6JT10_MELUD